MMLPFPSLLRRAWHTCNRFSLPIAVITLVLGIGLILARTALWGSLSVEFLQQTRTVLGEPAYAELERKMEDGADSQQISAFLSDKLAIKMNEMPEEQREPYLLSLMTTSFQRTAHVAVPLAVILFLLSASVRVSFLVIAARKLASLPEVIAQSARVFFPVLGAWFGMWICAGIWVPFAVFLIGFVWPPILFLALPSLAPLVVWLPRFALAPVIVVEEKKTVTAALRASYMRTRGKWWDVLSAVLAMEAVLWVLLSLIGSLLAMLVDAVAKFSEFGFALYWLMPFIALIAVAYRQAFMVEMKAELKIEN